VLRFETGNHVIIFCMCGGVSWFSYLIFGLHKNILGDCPNSDTIQLEFGVNHSSALNQKVKMAAAAFETIERFGWVLDAEPDNAS